MSLTDEKLLYAQNGVFKRKTLNEGILQYKDGSFTNLTPAKDGNYILTYSDGNVGFVEQPAALESLNNTYFKTDAGSAIQVGTAGTIPVFSTNNTFKTINIPADNSRYLFQNGQFITFSKSINSQTGLNSECRGFLYANNNSFKCLDFPTKTGDYYLSYNNGSMYFEENDYSINTVTGRQLNNGLLFNNNNSFDVLNTKTAGSYNITFNSEGIPSLTPVSTTTTPTTVAKDSRVLVFSANGVPLIDIVSLRGLSVNGDNTFENEKQYLCNISFTLNCTDYENLMDYPSDTYIYITCGSVNLPMVYLGNPVPIHNVSMTGIVTVGTSFDGRITFNNPSNSTFNVLTDIIVTLLEV